MAPVSDPSRRTIESRLQWLVSGPLGRRLFFTIVVGLLPVAALAFYTLFQSAQGQKEDIIGGAQGTMRAIVSAVDAELTSSLASLDALAGSPRLAGGDLSGFDAEARALIARRPTWSNIVLSTPSAQQVINTYFPFGATLQKSSYPESIDEIVGSGEPGVGDVIFSRVLDSYTFAAHVPVRRDGQIVYVLTAVMRPDSLQQILRVQQVPENAVVGIFDRRYNVVARSMNQTRSVGKPASSGLIEILQQGHRSGWQRATTMEGASVYTVYYRSPLTGWSAAIGLPRDSLDRPILRAFLMLGGLLLASVAIGIVSALLVSRAITKPMMQLKEAAEAMGHGEFPRTPGSDLPEIREVAAALVFAHEQREALLGAERKARDLEHEARMLAERASRLKDEFLAMLGHELRNPLAAISSASHVLDAAVGKPNAQPLIESATAIVRRQSQHLARLTDDLLDAGRVVLGRIQLERHPLELSALVQNCVDTLRNSNRLANHALTLSLTRVWVDADATRIDQIVSNLLTNAVKYTPAPGRIDVRLERVGNQALFRVRDSGIGIEPELMPRIFDLFVQGERAPDRSQGGLGIGLTLVRRLAELHGGKVEVASAWAGSGSEFTVCLPAIEESQSPAAAGDLASPVPPRRIVIVEDNADVRTGLRQLLEVGGHTVSEAPEGRAGIELVLREKPDIALIDIGLPLLDGYAIARELRNRADASSVRLIAMSGYGSPEDIRMGLQAGFDSYLVKPVDPAKLRELIADCTRATVARAGSVSNVLPFSR
jgi:signal transduction histidine kinase/ActR/RegA family two-component response regulator